MKIVPQLFCEFTMPYKTLSALPESIRQHLPKHTQEIYLAAFNNAWEEYRDPGQRRGKASREEVAHKVAWLPSNSNTKRKQTSGNGKSGVVFLRRFCSCSQTMP
jgi:cation transport regulator